MISNTNGLLVRFVLPFWAVPAACDVLGPSDHADPVMAAECSLGHEDLPACPVPQEHHAQEAGLGRDLREFCERLALFHLSSYTAFWPESPVKRNLGGFGAMGFLLRRFSMHHLRKGASPKLVLPLPLKKQIGAGDLVQKVTEILGVKPCGPCEERRRRMNALLGFGRRS